MQTVSSDEIIKQFETSLTQRGLTDFWFSGPFVWKTLQLFETREKLAALELHAYAANQPPFKIVLQTPIGKITCAIIDPEHRPTPAYDERHLPTIEWLLCDWVSTPTAIRSIGIGKFRRRLMQVIQGQTSFPFSFEEFQELASSFPQRSNLPQLVLQLIKMTKGSFHPTGSANIQMDPIEEMVTNLSVCLSGPTPEEEPDHLALLPIPCDRNGKALRILARDETEELTRRYKRFGDIAARNTIALSNVGLAYRVSQKFWCQDVTKDDLVQEGYIGLFRSVEDFDASRNVLFSTYSTGWIRAKMSRFLDKDKYATSAPTTEAKGARDKERAAHLSLSSVNKNTGWDCPGNQTLDDRLPDPEQIDTDAALDVDNIVAELAHIIQMVLDELDDPRYRILVERRILADPPETLDQVGIRLNISRERVRQIETNFHQRLRKVMLT